VLVFQAIAKPHCSRRTAQQ